MNARKINSVNYPFIFQMKNSGSPVLGIIPSVLISKNGSPFVIPNGSVVEVGNGFYALSANENDRNALGELALYATGTDANPTLETYAIVSYDPFELEKNPNLTTQDIWEYRNRTLTYSPENIMSVSDTGLSVVRGDTLFYQFTGLDLTNYSSSYFTVKKNYQNDDCESVIQVNSGSGLIYLNGVRLTSGSSQATLTAGSATTNGVISLKIDAGVTKNLPYSSVDYYYDLQIITTTGSIVTPFIGSLSIIRDVTKKIT